MDWNFYIAQTIGILTTVGAVVTVQFKNIRTILVGEIILNLLVALNFVLLDGTSGAGVCILATVQTIWIYFYSRNGKRFPLPINIGFMIGYIAVSVFSFSGFPSVLSCIAALFYALSVTQPNAKKYRIYMLMNSLIWVVYDIDLHAWTSIFTHGFLAASVVVAMARLDIKKRVK
ncbi:MAG: YgjV family protein [Clostridia bacterium]|nr:YgjV family protein [Clostridia bacterium]